MIEGISRELKCRILVVDNASTDRTGDIARGYGVEVLYESARGKGNALRSGFRQSTAEILVIVDGDCTYDLSVLPELVDAVQDGADMVVCTRIPAMRSAFPFMHTLGNWLFNLIQNRLFRAGVQDSFSGYRAFSRAFVARFSGDAQGFDIETDLNVHASLVNARVVNIEGQYWPRPDNSHSKLSTVRDGFLILRRTLSASWRWKPLRLGAAFSISLSVLGLALATWQFRSVVELESRFVSPWFALAVLFVAISGVVTMVSLRRHRHAQGEALELEGRFLSLREKP